MHFPLDPPRSDARNAGWRRPARAAALVIGWWLPLVLTAQELPLALERDVLAPDTEPEAHDQGVFLDDSFEAEELIADARQRAAAGEWPMALDKYEQVLDQFGHKVISTSDGMYTSIVYFINSHIAQWPPEGLAAYRERFEQRATLQFARALDEQDLNALARLVDRYLCTQAALRAGIQLSDLYVERGAFGKADAILRRLLEDHPDARAHYSDLVTHRAICIALGGDVAGARALLNMAGIGLADHRIIWQEQAQPASAVIDAIEAMPAIDSHRGPISDVGWPAHLQTAAQVPASLTDLPTAPLWSFREFEPTTLSRGDGYFQNSSYRNALDKGKFLALYPLVTDHTVFFNDAVTVWALSEQTGELLWMHKGITNEGAEITWQDRSVPSLHACSAYQGRLYVELGNKPISYYGYQPPRSQSLLCCLEAISGQLIWKVAPAEFGEDPKEVQFEGPVLAGPDGVFVLTRRRKSFGFEDAYLWKLNHDGLLQWKTHLGSSSTGGFGYRYPTLSIPTIVDDLIIVQSNLGSIMGIDISTGLVRWACVYPRQTEPREDWRDRSSRAQLLPWQYNAPLIWRQTVAGLPTGKTTDPALLPSTRIVSAPLDIDDLLLIDGANGEIDMRLPLAELGRVHSLLGIVDGKLYAAGEEVVCYDLSERKVQWSATVGEHTPYGRPALSATHIFVPCVQGLLAFSIEGGPPQVKPWQGVNEGGNTIILPERILVAGNEHITAYGLRENVFAQLERQMALRPDDPLPALELAEVAYRTAATQAPGQTKESDYQRGRSALDEAIRRAGGLAATWPDEFKRKFFDDCLQFALGRLDDQPQDVDAAIELFELAGRCPPTAEMALVQLMHLAGAYLAKEDYTRTIRQYHHVLSDRSLRDLDWPDSGENPVPAHRVCRRRIGELISEHGRQVYNVFDQHADTMLAAARQTNNLDALELIITTLPNSLAAPKALILKAHILRERIGQPIRAARYFYAALVKYPEHIDAAETIRQLADSYLQAGRPQLSWKWLTRGARLYPRAVVRIDNQNLTLLQYRDHLALDGRNWSTIRPMFKTPISAQFKLEVTDADYLLTPVNDKSHESVAAYFLIWKPRRLSAHACSSGEQLWEVNLEFEQRPTLLNQSADMLTIATQFEIQAFGAAEGRQLWKIGSRPPGVDAPETDPEEFPQWRFHAFSDERLLSIRTDGLARLTNVRSGEALWVVSLDHKPNRTPCLTQDFIIYPALAGDSTVLPVLSIDDGSVVQLIKLPQSKTVTFIEETMAGNVLIASTHSITAVDPVNGKVEWHRQFQGSLDASSIRALLDGVVVSMDGVRLAKINLDDGETMWQSEPVGDQVDGLSIFPQQDTLYVSNRRTLLSVDPYSGRKLAEVTLPEGFYLQQLLRSARNLVLISRSFGHDEQFTRIYLALAEMAWGLDQQISREDLTLLGEFEQPVEYYLYQGAIIGASEASLHGWVSSPE